MNQWTSPLDAVGLADDFNRDFKDWNLELQGLEQFLSSFNWDGRDFNKGGVFFLKVRNTVQDTVCSGVWCLAPLAGAIFFAVPLGLLMCQLVAT